MKFKALVATFSASFDELVRKIENHEAVADCVIQDVREAAAKIRSQLNLTQTRLRKLQLKEKTLEEEGRRWRERALACREQDEEKALRCMQALKQNETSLENLRHLIRENEQLLTDLESHLLNVEQKLAEIQGKRESLSARSARNKAESSALRSTDPQADEGVFERWETQVIADEYRNSSYSSSNSTADLLDREFRKQEDRASLLAELHALKRVSATEHTGDEHHEHAR